MLGAQILNALNQGKQVARFRVRVHEAQRGLEQWGKRLVLELRDGRHRWGFW